MVQEEFREIKVWWYFTLSWAQPWSVSLVWICVYLLLGQAQEACQRKCCQYSSGFFSFFGKAKSCFPFGCQPWTFRIDLCTIWSATETPIFFFFFVPSLSCLFILLFLKARFVWVANSAGRHFWRMENATSVIGSMFLHAPTNRCCNCFFILLKSPFHALVNTCWQHVAMLCWGCWFLVAFVEYLQIVKNNKSLLDR